MNKVLTASFVGLLSAFAAQLSTSPLKFEKPKGWPKPVYDFAAHPVSTEGYELGKELFHDPILSRDSTISCASCHLQFTNFTHVDHRLSHGIDGRQGTRNTLAIVNAAWKKTLMWDGAANHLEVQALAPLHNPVEMDFSLEGAQKRLARSVFYREKFADAFPGDVEITGQRILQAMAQYVVMLTSANSKYDRVMRGESGIAFTETEANGYKLFKVHCANCHTEPLFTNDEFANNGLPVDTFLMDNGRQKISGLAADSLKFKVPTLRNIEVSYPYMHDGRFRNLPMVLFHYTNGIAQSSTLHPSLSSPLPLGETEKRDLIAFMKTLTDHEFLRNPSHRPKPR